MSPSHKKAILIFTALGFVLLFFQNCLMTAPLPIQMAASQGGEGQGFHIGLVPEGTYIRRLNGLDCSEVQAELISNGKEAALRSDNCESIDLAIFAEQIDYETYNPEVVGLGYGILRLLPEGEEARNRPFDLVLCREIEEKWARDYVVYQDAITDYYHTHIIEATRESLSSKWQVVKEETITVIPPHFTPEQTLVLIDNRTLLEVVHEEQMDHPFTYPGNVTDTSGNVETDSLNCRVRNPTGIFNPPIFNDPVYFPGNVRSEDPQLGVGRQGF